MPSNIRPPKPPPERGGFFPDELPPGFTRVNTNNHRLKKKPRPKQRTFVPCDCMLNDPERDSD